MSNVIPKLMSDMFTALENHDEKKADQLQEEVNYIRAVNKKATMPTIEDFKDYIPGGKRSDPAPVNFFWDKCMPGSDLYVKAYNPDFKMTIQKIHEAGGLAIVAHPYQTFYEHEERLQYALDCGIDGLEAYSNYHKPFHNTYYEDFAHKHNLLITCGSDFHGEKKPSIRLGEYGLTKDGTSFLETFLQALK